MQKSYFMVLFWPGTKDPEYVLKLPEVSKPWNHHNPLWVHREEWVDSYRFQKDDEGTEYHYGMESFPKLPKDYKHMDVIEYPIIC